MTAKIVNRKGRDLAKDVLAQLRYQKIKAGQYIHYTTEVATLVDDSETCDMQAQKIISKLRQCSVCAKGALVLAYIKKYNTVKINDIHDTACDTRKLAQLMDGFFSREQLNLIEEAFEGRDVCGDGDYSDNYNFQKFVEKYPDDKKRLRLIMQNIVKNGGILVAEKLLKETKSEVTEAELNAGLYQAW